MSIQYHTMQYCIILDESQTQVPNLRNRVSQSLGTSPPTSYSHLLNLLGLKLVIGGPGPTGASVSSFFVSAFGSRSRSAQSRSGQGPLMDTAMGFLLAKRLEGGIECANLTDLERFGKQHRSKIERSRQIWKISNCHIRTCLTAVHCNLLHKETGQHKATLKKTVPKRMHPRPSKIHPPSQGGGIVSSRPRT